MDDIGTSIFQSDAAIYGFALSPDTYRLVVYHGNTDHVVLNRLTGRQFELPKDIHAWTWLPDSNSLLGQVSVGLSPRSEEVVSTALHAYQLDGQRQEVELPLALDGAALQILDISTSGDILLTAERVIPEAAYLGVFVLALDWGGRSGQHRPADPGPTGSTVRVYYQSGHVPEDS